jgi:hypothetical protein
MTIFIAWLFRLEGERVRWARAFGDRDAALAAVGLDEDSLR